MNELRSKQLHHHVRERAKSPYRTVGVVSVCSLGWLVRRAFIVVNEEFESRKTMTGLCKDEHNSSTLSRKSVDV